MIQLLPVLSGIMWGSAGIFVRILTEYGMDSITIVESRVVPAVVILLGGLFIADKNLLKVKLRDIWIFLCTGVLSMLGLNLCYNEAIKELTLSLAAVLLCLSPVFVLGLAAVIFKEKLTKQKIFCAVLALIGCVLSSGVLEEIGSVKWTVFGIFIGVLSAFFLCTVQYILQSRHDEELSFADDYGIQSAGHMYCTYTACRLADNGRHYRNFAFADERFFSASVAHNLNIAVRTVHRGAELC